MADQIDRRTCILFGSLSSGMSNKIKSQKTSDAVNPDSFEPRTMEDIKKKWSDFKHEAKKQHSHYAQLQPLYSDILMTCGQTKV